MINTCEGLQPSRRLTWASCKHFSSMLKFNYTVKHSDFIALNSRRENGGRGPFVLWCEMIGRRLMKFSPVSSFFYPRVGRGVLLGWRLLDHIRALVLKLIPLMLPFAHDGFFLLCFVFGVVFLFVLFCFRNESILYLLWFQDIRTVVFHQIKDLQKWFGHPDIIKRIPWSCRHLLVI